MDGYMYCVMYGERTADTFTDMQHNTTETKHYPWVWYGVMYGESGQPIEIQDSAQCPLNTKH